MPLNPAPEMYERGGSACLAAWQHQRESPAGRWRKSRQPRPDAGSRLAGARRLPRYRRCLVPVSGDAAAEVIAAEAAKCCPRTIGAIKRLLNHHLPPLDACFADEMREIERALDTRPWEKIEHQAQ